MALKWLRNLLSSKREGPLLKAGIPGPQGSRPPIDIALTAVDADKVSAAITGPGEGVQALQACTPDFVLPWDQGREWAYGEAISLYDISSTGERNGEPIADCFGLVTYGGNASGAVLAVADGVAWGPVPRRAARCAVLGCLQHMHQAMGRIASEQKGESPSQLTSNGVFSEMIASMYRGQELIIDQLGSLTTLVLTVVMPQAASCPHYKHWTAREAQKARASHSSPCSGSWAAMTLTVGDSAAWVWRARTKKVDELTAASHEGEIRNVRWVPGVLGHALGEDPDLANLTLSITLLEPGDVVFLGSDGVADNFNLDQLQLARHSPPGAKVQLHDPSLPPMLGPAEMQFGHLRLLENAVWAAGRAAEQMDGQEAGQADGQTGSQPISRPKVLTFNPTISARVLVKGLLEQLTQSTEPLRQATARLAREAEQRKANNEPEPDPFTAVEGLPPGKLDHAALVAYQVGATCCAATG